MYQFESALSNHPPDAAGYLEIIARSGIAGTSTCSRSPGPSVDRIFHASRKPRPVVSPRGGGGGAEAWDLERGTGCPVVRLRILPARRRKNSPDSSHAVLKFTYTYATYMGRSAPPTWRVPTSAGRVLGSLYWITGQAASTQAP